ncbi:hypothetical protein J1N35_024704 [Gossypium stocksii]|uniref:Uncharacterized protein n=1 Tax=Gossypium stocksii TaxID=47602 RepID=A0A9D3ZWZ8_9ROSI|nr:hypothetical protein J1N35_024704 [Gossypium stocksii]
MKVGTKVLSKIQLVEDVLYGRNIGSIDGTAKEAPLEMLVGHETNMKHVELAVKLPLMREVSCASAFGGKVVMQTGKLGQVNITSEYISNTLVVFYILTYLWLGKDTWAL